MLGRLARTMSCLLLSWPVWSAAPVSAAPVTLTGGTLTVRIGSLPPLSVSLNGPQVVSVTSGYGSFDLPATAFGPATLALPRSIFTGVPQLSGLTLAGVANGAQTLSCTAGGCSGTGGLHGKAVVNVLQLLNLSIPLAVVGDPGAHLTAGAGAIIVYVDGQGWTTGTAVVGPLSPTVYGNTVFIPQTTTVTAMGSDQRTPGHGGQITLVTGFHFLNNVTSVFPSFAIETLRFAAVPEPGPLALAVTGALGLLLLATRRARRR